MKKVIPGVSGTFLLQTKKRATALGALDAALIMNLHALCRALRLLKGARVMIAQ